MIHEATASPIDISHGNLIGRVDKFALSRTALSGLKIKEMNENGRT